MASRTDGVWRFLRNLFAFIGGGIAIVGGAIGIWGSITTAKSDVIASIEINRFTLPSPVNKALAESNARSFAELIKKAKSSAQTDEAAKNDDAGKTQGAFEFAAFDRGRAPEPAIPTLDTYVRMSVVNQGDAPAKSLSIKLPEDLFYVIVEREDGAQSEAPYRKRIEVGELAPRQALRVHAWSAAPVDNINANQLIESTIVSYDLGMADVRAQATPVIREYYNERWWKRVTIPLLLGAILGLIGLAIFEYNRRTVRELAKTATRDELEAFAKAIQRELDKDDTPF